MPDFQKRHYEKIAAEMRVLRVVWSGNPDTEQVIEDVVNTLAHMFDSDNHRFNVDKFKQACL